MPKITMKQLLEKAGLSVEVMEKQKFYDVKDKDLKIIAYHDNKPVYKKINYLVYKGDSTIWNLIDSDGTVRLRGRNDHRVFDVSKGTYVNLDNYSDGRMFKVQLRDGSTCEVSVVKTDIIEPIVDMEIEGLNYFSNDILSHNTVFHAFLGEQLDSADRSRDLVKKVFENSRIPYLTVSPTFSHCPKHGYIKGDSKTVCPKCKEEQESIYHAKLAELEKRVVEINEKMKDKAGSDENN